MNRQLTPDELATLPTMIPTMSRREKLHRLAYLIRNHPRSPLYIFSNLEHFVPETWAGIEHPHSAFALAAADTSLIEAGLKGGSVGQAVEFFSLTRDELHAFSCDCGGAIGNEEMARRVEEIANAG